MLNRRNKNFDTKTWFIALAFVLASCIIQTTFFPEILRFYGITIHFAFPLLTYIFFNASFGFCFTLILVVGLIFTNFITLPASIFILSYLQIYLLIHFLKKIYFWKTTSSLTISCFIITLSFPWFVDLNTHIFTQYLFTPPSFIELFSTSILTSLVGMIGFYMWINHYAKTLT